jgi:hypothetical protein
VVASQPATAAARVSLWVVVIDFPADTVRVVLQKKRAGRWVKARSRRLGPGPTVGDYSIARVTFKVRPEKYPVKARSGGTRTKTTPLRYKAGSKPTAIYVSFPPR